MGISLVANYGDKSQVQSFLKTKSNKGAMVGTGIGVATGLAASYPQIKNYLNISKNLKEMSLGDKKDVFKSIIEEKDPNFSPSKFMKNMKKGAVASTILNTVGATVVGLGVGFLVDNAIDFVNDKKAKKAQQNQKV